MLPAPRFVVVTIALVAACNAEPTANVGGLTQVSSETTAADTSTASETTGVASSEGSPADTSGSSNAGGSSSTEDTGAGPLLDVGSAETGVSDTCIDAPDEIHVLVLQDQHEIWSFDPVTVSFEPVTTLGCPELADALYFDTFSIARDGEVWLLSRHVPDDGDPWLMKISHFTPGSGSCEIVWSGALPDGLDSGDMAFASTLDDPDHERLFLHRNFGVGLDEKPIVGLIRLDPQDAAPVPMALADDTFGSAPLAGTGDGRLYGLAGELNDPSATVVLEFDQETGLVANTLPAPGLNFGDNPGQYALAFYAGDLYAFGIRTDPVTDPELLIHRFDLDDDDGNGDHDIEKLEPAQPLPFLSWLIMAAASPTCIPLGPEG